MALRLSPGTAAIRLAQAQRLDGELSATRQAWRDGRLDAAKVRAVLDATANLPAETATRAGSSPGAGAGVDRREVAGGAGPGGSCRGSRWCCGTARAGPSGAAGRGQPGPGRDGHVVRDPSRAGCLVRQPTARPGRLARCGGVLRVGSGGRRRAPPRRVRGRPARPTVPPSATSRRRACRL
ncbi:DUF222 domain-containing protein [Pseudonocardia sp. S2-4]|uniref:DUF222 domain-containing protein n=1 Tax=Pseudonocardia humida TaxID=2800819 RepID=A0ABT0ZV85_9PSEU|nr:DUF222 domain-containing protein [Pseudonocardia humida]